MLNKSAMKIKKSILSILPTCGRDAARFVGVFLLCDIILTMLLVATQYIPQKAMEANIRTSAEYLVEGDLFGERIRNIYPSRIDRYADSILLGIAWQTNTKHPVKQTMWSSYYHDKLHNENKNLLTAVREHRKPNQQYLRYWHGSLVILRPLLLLFDIGQIYIVVGVILFALLALLLDVLYRKVGELSAVVIGASFIVVGGWYVPYSLEYVWMFLIAFISSLSVVRFGRKGWGFALLILFLVTGMLASFLDFLTTETLTLTLPLLLFLHINRGETLQPDPRICVIKAGLSWGIGYVGMWVSKWILAAVVLKKNVLPYVSDHVTERIGGGIYGVSTAEFYLKALYYNINCLFPFAFGKVGMVFGVTLCAVAVIVGFKYKKAGADRAYLWALFMVAVIPYLRFLVLHNHSFIHFFFTYRAQMSAVAAVLFFVAEVIGCERKGKQEK